MFWTQVGIAVFCALSGMLFMGLSVLQLRRPKDPKGNILDTVLAVLGLFVSFFMVLVGFVLLTLKASLTIGLTISWGWDLATHLIITAIIFWTALAVKRDPQV